MEVNVNNTAPSDKLKTCECVRVYVCMYVDGFNGMDKILFQTVVLYTRQIKKTATTTLMEVWL